MIFKREISKSTTGSAFPLMLRRLSLNVVLAIVLTGCSSDDIKCWPFCGKSSSGVTDTTETVVDQNPIIIVTYPGGGEVLGGGGTHTVTWTKTSSVGKVRIDVYDNTSSFIRWLGDKVNETHIDWEIQEPNGLFRIKVTSYSDSSVYDYSGYFQINTSPQDD